MLVISWAMEDYKLQFTGQNAQCTVSRMGLPPPPPPPPPTAAVSADPDGDLLKVKAVLDEIGIAPTWAIEDRVHALHVRAKEAEEALKQALATIEQAATSCQAPLEDLIEAIDDTVVFRRGAVRVVFICDSDRDAKFAATTVMEMLKEPLP